MVDEIDEPNRIILLKTKRFEVERVAQATRTGETRMREVIRHPGAVVILPILDSGHVCLIRNYRVAVDQTLVELPAGTLEPPEPPLAAAGRELIEETGYHAGELKLLHSFYASPGILDEQMLLVLATKLTAGQPSREPGEEIDNAVMSWESALGMIDDGTIRDAKTIVGLLYYDRWLRRTVNQSPDR